MQLKSGLEAFVFLCYFYQSNGSFHSGLSFLCTSIYFIQYSRYLSCSFLGSFTSSFLINRI